LKKDAPKILYVEDDLNLGFVTQDNLELNGFKVYHCKDGQEALTAFGSQTFDLCVLDVMLPKLDGFELAKTIRKQNTDIPILFLTAKSLKSDKIEGLKLGGDDYITKPFSIEELILKIEIFLKRSKIVNPKSKPEQFKLGKYAFDFSLLQLQIGEEIMTLTLKEAELLRLFALHPNEVLKRDYILKEVWGDDDYFSGRSMDVFISRLRGYLKQDKSIEIKNIHSVGFVFSCRTEKTD
jgi:DNA-binding response OmpR family regulator